LLMGVITHGIDSLRSCYDQPTAESVSVGNFSFGEATHLLHPRKGSHGDGQAAVSCEQFLMAGSDSLKIL